MVGASRLLRMALVKTLPCCNEQIDSAERLHVPLGPISGQEAKTVEDETVKDARENGWRCRDAQHQMTRSGTVSVRLVTPSSLNGALI